LAAWRVLLALAQSASVPAIAGIMADCFSAKGRSTAVSIYLLSSPLSLIAASLVGGRVADLADWRTAVVVFGGIGGTVVVLVLVCLREPRRTERVQNVGLGETGAPLVTTIATVLSVPSFWLFGLAYVLASNTILASQYWLPRFFHDQFDLNLTNAGLLSTWWIQGGTILGLLVGGPWADLWSRRHKEGKMAVQMIGLLAWLPALPVIGLSRSLPLLCPLMLLLGCGVGLYLAQLWATTFEIVDPAARSTAIGLLNVAAGTAGFGVSPLIGYLLEQKVVTSLGTIFVTMAGVTVVAVLLLACCTKFTLSRDYRGTAK
jgi:MFS family permease